MNSLKNKIAAAKIMNLYGASQFKNKKLKETLKCILNKSEMQEVYDHRKELLEIESTLLQSDYYSH